MISYYLTRQGVSTYKNTTLPPQKTINLKHHLPPYSSCRNNIEISKSIVVFIILRSKDDRRINNTDVYRIHLYLSSFLLIYLYRSLLYLIPNIGNWRIKPRNTGNLHKT